jgi:hypothetical protein
MKFYASSTHMKAMNYIYNREAYSKQEIEQAEKEEREKVDHENETIHLRTI